MDENIIVTPTDKGVETSIERTTHIETTDFTPLQGMMGMQEATKEDREQLSDVWKYFNPDGKKSAAEVMWAVRDVENKLQPARMGETRFSKVLEYVKLRKSIETDERLLKLL